jgi:hypothetical protein
MATPRPGPQTWVDGRSVAAVGPTPTPAVVPQLPSQGNGVFDFGSETQDGARGDTSRPGPVITPPKPGHTANRPWLCRRRLTLFAAGGLLLAVGAIAAYFAFSKKTPPPDTTSGPTTRRLVVSKSAGEGHFTSLREALAKAAAGDTIVIAEERINEPTIGVTQKTAKDVTVESGLPGGKPAVIEFGSTGAGRMLSVSSAEGFRLRNVELDGKGSADIGVDLVGRCPGATFESVTVRGVKTTGFRLLNVAGDTGRPVTLDRVRVVGPLTHAGVEMIAHPGLETRWVVLRGSRFEAGKAGVRIDGATSELEVSGNRFFKLDAAVAFGKPPDGKTVQGQVTANTMYEAATGILFDFPPESNEPRGKFALTVGQNYFGKTASVLRSGGAGGPVAGVTMAENGFGPGSKPGNFPSPGVVPAEGPDLPTNPDEDTFLRFPGAPPTVGPNKAAVGAKQ